MNKLIKKEWLIIGILLLGFFLRIYNLQGLFYYSHDNDLAGWFIKDVLVNHHLRLIGQETSTHGIFIGPIFYYLQIPFYLLSGLDPIGGTLLVALLGTLTVWSFFYVFSKIWNKTTGQVGASIYAISFYTILNDREIVPTMPVILWSLWFFFGIWLLIRSKQKLAWPILGILLGLIWHLNFALVLLTPLMVIARMLKRIKLDLKSITIGLLFCFLLSIPLIAFEVRHNFQQSHALIVSLTTDQQDVVSGLDKVIRTIHLASKNVVGLLWGPLIDIPVEIVHLGVLCVFMFMAYKKKVEPIIGVIMTFWILAFLTFFSLYSKILSEYYLNGMIVIYVAIISLAISTLIASKKWKYLGLILLSGFILVNAYRFFTIPVNHSGYVERKSVIAEIKRDADARGYHCASISYITDPGRNLGYRYFIWRTNLKTKPISQEVPVYTIVFPLKPMFHEDKSFGAIGLIYPEYSKYNTESVNKVCEGADWNLEEPMFGHTE